jgi:hypothetical protein
MPDMRTITRGKSAATLVLLLASLALGACGGGSSSSSSSTTTASTSASTSSKGAPARALGSRLAALHECLQKHGITLPKQTPGQLRPPGGGFLGGGAGTGLPKGVTRTQYQAALKKCRGGFPRRGNRASSPAFKQALGKFAACMRANGVRLPEPNTSGAGPIFNTKGLNTASAQFRAADIKCAGDLRASFRGAPGKAGGAPPAAG